MIALLTLLAAHATPGGALPPGEIPEDCATNLGNNLGVYNAQAALRPYLVDITDLDAFDIDRQDLPADVVAMTAAVRAADLWNSQTQVGTLQYVGTTTRGDGIGVPHRDSLLQWKTYPREGRPLLQDVGDCGDDFTSVVSFIDNCGSSDTNGFGYANPMCLDADGMARAFHIVLSACRAPGQVIQWQVDPDSVADGSKEAKNLSETLLHEFGHTFNRGHDNHEFPLDPDQCPEPDSMPQLSVMNNGFSPPSRVGTGATLYGLDRRCSHAHIASRARWFHRFDTVQAWPLWPEFALSEIIPGPALAVGSAQGDTIAGMRTDRSVAGPVINGVGLSGGLASVDDAVGVVVANSWHNESSVSLSLPYDLEGFDLEPDTEPAWWDFGDLGDGPRMFWSAASEELLDDAEWTLIPSDEGFNRCTTTQLGHPLLVGGGDPPLVLPVRTCADRTFSGDCTRTPRIHTSRRIAIEPMDSLQTQLVAWVEQHPEHDDHHAVRLSLGSLDHDLLYAPVDLGDDLRSYNGPGLACGDGLADGYDCILAYTPFDDVAGRISVIRFSVVAGDPEPTLDLDPVRYDLLHPTTSDLTAWAEDGSLWVGFRALQPEQPTWTVRLTDFHPEEGFVGSELWGPFVAEGYSELAPTPSGGGNRFDSLRPEAAPINLEVGTCASACGGESAGCWCDDACEIYGDCCEDYADFCGVASGGDTCAGICGAQADDGCWCDDACETYGDCCSDHAQVCLP